MDDKELQQRSRVEAFAHHGRKTIELGDGLQVTIRKVSRSMLMARGAAPFVAAFARQGQGQFNQPSPDLEALMRTFFALGIVDPPVWVDRGAVPPGYIVFEDLGEFHDLLFDELLQWSGWTKELADAARFRGGERNGVAADALRESTGADAA